ncbi:MAG: hypothetical protein LBS40_07640 [Burkholderiales bacterium]|jgi:DNA polymerase-3 subunit delta'|nr:hypothetical protein [Burkholderiales bacterium]
MSRKSEDFDYALDGMTGWRDAYPWQTVALAQRLRDPEQWFPQSLLIHGVAGIGKRTLALNAARALLCDTPRDDHFACGRCASCHYVMQGQHPDLILIEPLEYDENGESKTLENIPVDAIRRMIGLMQVTSHRQRGKIAVIVPAEKMNLAAANALLKTLEEPTSGNRLILVAHQWKRLPATILSRCQRWAAPYPSERDALAFLQAEQVTDPKMLLAQAGGAPLRALAMDDPEMTQMRQSWLATLVVPKRLSPFAEAQTWAAGSRDDVKANFAQWLDVLIAWIGDLARVCAGGDARHYPEYNENMRALAPQVVRAALFRYHRILLQQRRRLSYPLQPRLIVEALLADYRALFFSR